MADASRQAVPEVDVAICGGGLAGLCLARQLRRERPDLSVTVIEREVGPLPDAAHKVGESMAETGAYYLTDVLGMRDLLEETQLPKLGLRFFFPGTAGASFCDRPEMGLSRFPETMSFQIDRGRFETELRRQIVKDGTVLREGCRVEGIELGQDGAPHRIEFRRSDGNREALSASWVIDATGRKRFLQRQLGLSRRCRGEAHNAVWFRVRGRVELSNLTPNTEAEWHGRVMPNDRWHSTSHLVDKGYWVWLIPLASECTSIGIVATDRLHPLAGYQTWPRAKAWLETHEPDLAGLIAGREILDFKALHDYSYSANRVFSADRWGSVGESGVFADPLYSPGTDLIGISNCCATRLIGQERDGEDIRDAAEHHSRFVIALNESLTRSIQSGYEVFGCAPAMAAKLLWDFAAAWAFVAPQMFNGVFLDAQKSSAFRASGSRFFSLSLRMQQLFRDWAGQSTGRTGFRWFDYLSVPRIAALRTRNLQPGKDLDQLLSDHQENLKDMEELAQILFLAALQDVHPDDAGTLATPVWLNAWGIVLDPDKWANTGLRQPKSQPRDLSSWHRALAPLFQPACPP